MEPIFASLDRHYCTTSRRYWWFLSAPGTVFDHLALSRDSHLEALDVVRQINAVRQNDGRPNIYVKGI